MNQDKATLQFSVIAPPISSQCLKQGVEPTAMSMDVVNATCEAVNALSRNGFLTDKETNKIRERIIKSAQFKKTKQTIFESKTVVKVQEFAFDVDSACSLQADLA